MFWQEFLNECKVISLNNKISVDLFHAVLFKDVTEIPIFGFDHWIHGNSKLSSGYVYGLVLSRWIGLETDLIPA